MGRPAIFPDAINKCGIYAIRHIASGKTYVGKSKNIGRRFTQYLYDYKNSRRRQINEYLFNAISKYGIAAFSFFVLEEITIVELADRELFWINKLKSYDRNYGYNLRLDSSSNSTVVASTRVKLSEIRRKEWADGKRSGHSSKLKENWKTRDREAQANLFSKTLTKYKYLITENGEIVGLTFKELKSRKLSSILSTFSRKRTDVGVLRGIRIERIKVDG